MFDVLNVHIEPFDRDEFLGFCFMETPPQYIDLLHLKHAACDVANSAVR